MPGGSAPEADPNIGLAALQSARLGEKAFQFGRQRALEAAQWARQDRRYYLNTFRPMERRFARDAENWDSAGRRADRAASAVADVQRQASMARGQNERAAASMGVDPNSGRFASAQAKTGLDTALAAAGASTNARRDVEREGIQMRGEALNMGRGMAVNPGSSFGLSNQAFGAGTAAGMQGYGQQGNLLNTQFQQQMQAWQANQGGISSLLGGLGALGGAFFSSKEVKEDKEPVEALEAVRKMPVEAWTYKEGVADGGRHIGPYAEDFHAATGLGDGKTIDPMSEIGLALGAVRELDAKVTQIAASVAALGATRKGARDPRDEEEDEDEGPAHEQAELAA